MTSADINLSIVNSGTGLTVKVLAGPQTPEGTNLGTTTFLEEFGFIADLPNGGQEPLDPIQRANNWNVWSYLPALNYYEYKGTSRWDGLHVPQGRFTGNQAFVIWNLKVGTSYFIPYNDFCIDYTETPGYVEHLSQYPGTPPYDGSFGAGVKADGGVHKISGQFTIWGKGVFVVTREVTVSSIPHTVPFPPQAAPVPPTLSTIADSTTKKKGNSGK